eukprot:419559-Amphidinium_carterae.1
MSSPGWLATGLLANVDVSLQAIAAAILPKSATAGLEASPRGNPCSLSALGSSIPRICDLNEGLCPSGQNTPMMFSTQTRNVSFKVLVFLCAGINGTDAQ